MTSEISGRVVPLSNEEWLRLMEVLRAPIGDDFKRELIDDFVILPQQVTTEIHQAMVHHGIQGEEIVFTAIAGTDIKAAARDIARTVVGTKVREAFIAPTETAPQEDEDPTEGGKWVSVAQIVEQTGQTPKTVFNHACSGKWKRKLVGTRLYYLAEDVKAYKPKKRGRPKRDIEEFADSSAAPEPTEEAIADEPPLPFSPATSPAGEFEATLHKDHPHHAAHKQPIEVGEKPLSRDPQIGDNGVYEIDGHLYVNTAVASSCVRMSATRFLKTKPFHGAPQEIRRHFIGGALEVYNLSDLKRSIFYNTTGRMGW